MRGPIPDAECRRCDALVAVVESRVELLAAVARVGDGTPQLSAGTMLREAVTVYLRHLLSVHRLAYCPGQDPTPARPPP